MPRPSRVDEAGGLYHALNRGNLRAEIFHKDEDYAAFETILHERLQRHQVQLFSDQLMPNHYHLVLRPLVDSEMSRFMGWIGGTHTIRYHAHYHTGGQGHVYQQRYHADSNYVPASASNRSSKSSTPTDSVARRR